MRKIFESKEITEFKGKTPYETRREEASKVIEKNPELIPVILLRKRGSKTIELEQKKFLFKKNWKISEMINYLRDKINRESESTSDKAKKVLFVTLRGNVSPLATCTLQNLYDDYLDEDRFLYIVYSEEDFTG